MVLVALLGLGSAVARADGEGTFQDPYVHFRVSFPSRFTALPVSEQGRVFMTGVVVSNTPLDLTRAQGKPWKLPPNTVVFALTHTAGGPSITPTLSASKADPRLPLSQKDFRPVSWPPFRGAYLWRSMWLNGWAMRATVVIGPRATPSDKEAIWRTIASLQLPPLHPGETTGNGFVVGQRTSAYPIRSITRIGSAFLIHAPHGFYAVSIRPFSGYGCKRGLRFSRSPLSFSCPDGRRWDRMGRALWSYANLNSGLGLAPTTINYDGHVLVSNGTTVGGTQDELEQQVWGRTR